MTEYCSRCKRSKDKDGHKLLIMPCGCSDKCMNLKFCFWCYNIHKGRIKEETYRRIELEENIRVD